MISLYCWNAVQKVGLLLNPELLRTHADRLRASADVYWIDMDNPTEEEEQLIFGEFFPIHRLSRSDIAYQRHHPETQVHLPKAEEFPDYLFVVVNPLRSGFMEEIKQELAGQLPKDHQPAVVQLSAVLTKRLLITHHREPVDAIVQLRKFLTKHEEQAGRGPDYLFHLVLDAMVDDFAPALDHFQETLEQMEEEVFVQPSAVMISNLLHLKRRIIILRKTLVYERELLARMMRGDFKLIDEREIAYYRNVYDHVVRFTELIESSREMVSDLMQTHLAAASNKLNEIMKVLTMISITILPMTLIAGIYGMNFEKNVWPFQNLEKAFEQAEYGFPTAIGLMVLSGVLALAFFRWMKWL